MIKQVGRVLNISNANRELNRLVGLPWTGLGRSLNLVWFVFGKDVYWRDYRGRLTEKSAFALHVQRAFRISEGDRLILGSADLYELAAGEPEEDRDNNLEGLTLFDQRAAELKTTGALSTVVATMITNLGDVRIDFESGLRLEILNASSGIQEAWRLLVLADPDLGFVFPEDAETIDQQN